MLTKGLGAASTLAVLLRATRSNVPTTIQTSTRFLRHTPAATLQTLSRRAFTIPAKPKKGSSAESSPRRSRATKGPGDAVSATGEKVAKPKAKTSRTLSPEAKAKKKELALKKKETAAAKKALLKERALKKKQQNAKKLAKSKPLSDEQKAKNQLKKKQADLRALRAAALVVPRNHTTSGWTVFTRDNLKVDTGRESGSMSGASIKEKLTESMRASARAFKIMSPSEREHYNTIANKESLARESTYKAWVQTHTAEEIRLANIARKKLRASDTRGRWPAIEDDRIPSVPTTPFMRFSISRWASGDFKGVKIEDGGRLIGSEWKSLGEDARKEYLDAYHQERAEWKRELASTD